MEKRFFDDYFNFNVIEGRLPENENEIVLNKDVLSSLNGDYRVGSVVEANIRQFSNEDRYMEAMGEVYGEFDEKVDDDLDEFDKMVQ